MVAGIIIAGITGCNNLPIKSPSEQASSAFNITLPSTEYLVLSDLNPVLALSPDGVQLVYVGREGNGQQLYVRQIDEDQSSPIAGTNGARYPFFSPDGAWVGFFAQGKLRKVPIGGGDVMVLADAPGPRGAHWGPDDTIIFAPTTDAGLSRVSAAGGDSHEVTRVDKDKELGHRWPQVLPDGNTLLYTAWDRDERKNRIVVRSLDTGKEKELVRGVTFGRYGPTGHLLYAQDGTLMAVPFDMGSLALSGEPVSVLDDVMQSSIGAMQYSYSNIGVLAYVPGVYNEMDRTLAWVDRKGLIKLLEMPRRTYDDPKLSPDGQKVAVQFKVAAGNVWTYDFNSKLLKQITFDGLNNQPYWSPDGSRIAFASDRAGGEENIYVISSDVTGPVERLTTSENSQSLTSWSSDGKWLVYYEFHPDTGRDIWVLPLEGERKPYPLLKTVSQEAGAMFSPDGRWLAYSSDETGEYEVYVSPFPEMNKKWKISTNGGDEPVWARNGREFLYRHADQMMIVEYTADEAFNAGTPKWLFEGPYVGPRGKNFSNYDISPDGENILMLMTLEQDMSLTTRVNVVLNWFEKLKSNQRINN